MFINLFYFNADVNRFFNVDDFVDTDNQNAITQEHQQLEKFNNLNQNSRNTNNSTTFASNLSFMSHCRTPRFNKFKKLKFFNNHFVNLPTTILSKKLKTNKAIKRHYRILIEFFRKFPRNTVLNKRSTKIFAYILVYFFLTHDLHLFMTQLTSFLQNTPRRYQLKLVRFLTLLNQSHYNHIFSYNGINGIYFKISGKFGGPGGSKKMRKHFVILQPKFSNRNGKLQRAVNTIWSFTGTTTWSVYAVYKN